MISSIHNDLTIVMVRKKNNVTQKVCLGNLLPRQIGEIPRMPRQLPTAEANFNAWYADYLLTFASLYRDLNSSRISNFDEDFLKLDCEILHFNHTKILLCNHTKILLWKTVLKLYERLDEHIWLRYFKLPCELLLKAFWNHSSEKGQKALFWGVAIYIVPTKVKVNWNCISLLKSFQ